MNEIDLLFFLGMIAWGFNLFIILSHEFSNILFISSVILMFSFSVIMALINNKLEKKETKKW